MNELITISGVSGYIDENGTAMLRLEDVAAMGDAAGELYAKTRGTHPCNIGKNTSYLYQSEYVVLEGYKGGAKNED